MQITEDHWRNIKLVITEVSTVTCYITVLLKTVMRLYINTLLCTLCYLYPVQVCHFLPKGIYCISERTEPCFPRTYATHAQSSIKNEIRWVYSQNCNFSHDYHFALLTEFMRHSSERSLCVLLCVRMSVSPISQCFPMGEWQPFCPVTPPCFFSPLCLSNNDSLICQPITPERYLNEPIRTSDSMTCCSS